MKRKLFLLLAAAVLLLSGCFAQNSDELYALPQRSKEYRELQVAVEAALGTGSYSAPVSGTNRQVLQQADLDGDGVEETLVFCKMDGERPLRVLVLRRGEERYDLMCTLEGEGTAFDSVQYAQIDGLPGQELLISRRIGEQVQQFLSVYSFREGTATELMSSAYNAYTTQDLDGDQLTDIFLLRSNADGPRAFADLYRYHNDHLQKDAEASLSTGADSVKRILTGSVAEGIPAVLVASAYDESNLITDVFALEKDVFTNISQNDESGQSSQTVRSYFVYSTDIDNDGVIELPNTLALAPIQGDESSLGQYRIVWYNLALDGTRTEKMSTYHNFAEGWYLYLPESWCESLCVTRALSADEQSGTLLGTLLPDGSVSRLVTIYTFSGDQAQSLSTQAGRFLLTQRGDVCYAAELAPGIGMDQEQLKTRFSFISLDLLPRQEG